MFKIRQNKVGEYLFSLHSGNGRARFGRNG